jgi:molybdopterin synthase catalytic subunit
MEIVTDGPIRPEGMFDNIRKSEAGSVIFHYAVVKSQIGGGASVGIEFQRAGDMEGEMSTISADLKQRWNIEDVLLVRRIGQLKVGDIISLIAVSSSASEDAFTACRHGLERLKKLKTLKKTEKLI